MAETAEAELKTEETAQAAPAAPGVEVNEVNLPNEAERIDPAGASGQIEILLDSTVPIEVSLGDRQITIREALELGPGSVVRLDRQVGEPVELFLRGVKFATGHLVVVGEQMGVRIKEIIQTAHAG
jgi:flagellar motor switch protein FliN/FliY